MTPLRRADQASTTHHHVLQKQATDNASALLFLNRFCCASRARRGQPRRSVSESAAPLRVGGRRAAPPGGIHRFACRHDAACCSGRTRAAAPNAPCLPAQPSAEDALHAGGCVELPWRASHLGGDSFRSACFSSCVTHRRGSRAAPRRKAARRGIHGAEPLPAPFRFPACFISPSEKAVRSVFIRGCFSRSVRWGSRGCRAPASRSAAPG